MVFSLPFSRSRSSGTHHTRRTVRPGVGADPQPAIIVLEQGLQIGDRRVCSHRSGRADGHHVRRRQQLRDDNEAIDQELIDSAKAGIFAASVVSAALGLALLAWVARKRS